MDIEPHEPASTTDARQRLRAIQTAMDDNPSRHAIAGAVYDLAEILERLLDDAPNRILP